MQFEEITKLLKTSSYWREDFKVVESAPGVYYVEADNQDASTHLAIACLDELLRTTKNR